MSEPTRTAVTDVPLLWALKAMGHAVGVATWEDLPNNRHWIGVRYGVAPLATAKDSIDHESLERARDPVALVNVTIARMFQALLPEGVLGGANAVVEYLAGGGTLPIEMVGGHRDGERFTNYLADQFGWPPDVIFVPVGTGVPEGAARFAPGPDDLRYVPLRYERHPLEPARMAWPFRLRRFR